MGLPAAFTAWRAGQDTAIVDALGSSKRFVALAMPTGSGKSIVGVGAVLLNGGKGMYVTATKGLQDQISADFVEAGVRDIRGQNNYPCEYEMTGSVACDVGPCHAGFKCDLKKNGCRYYDAVEAAKHASVVVTNYSYWMHQVEHGQGLGTDVDLLILDEAHDAESQLADYLSVELTPHDLEGLLGEDGLPDWDSVAKWREYAGMWSLQLGLKLAQYSVSREEAPDRKTMGYVKQLRGLDKRVTRLSEIQGEWVCEVVRRGPLGGRVARFHPVHPAAYAEKHLFAKASKVLLLSATLTPKTLELLGVKDYEYAEYPSTFPVERRLVTHVPTVRVDKNASAEHLKMWVSRLDDIIGARLDRKGIVHTVSYNRAHFLTRHSAYKDIMLLHDTAGTRSTVAQFRKSKAPCVLVSPSMTTGWDFPGSDCRYQVIAKLPFLDTRDVVLQARTKHDKEYSHYLTMQTLVQTAGRGVRSDMDWCETLIIDDHFGEWWWPKYKKFAPAWFKQAVQRSVTVPKPMQFSDGRQHKK